MLKVRADRRKNGRLRKYHYSKIQNAGDCVARTGVREIGFKFGSLPHDPGGITCMSQLSLNANKLGSLSLSVYTRIVHIQIQTNICRKIDFYH